MVSLGTKILVMPSTLCISFCLLKGIKPQIIWGWNKADFIASGILVNATELLLRLIDGLRCLSNWLRGEELYICIKCVCVYVIEFEQLDPVAKYTLSLGDSQLLEI